ncbi:FluC/FEX family fluoride channel [Bifidobacterium asteroides]|uniref:Fluoride-specific ion channel FluC n=1 Tax=Bifidobacterium asteroides TaxID=1684 RepID=A0A2N3RA79_9BIFI|nr:CrcB family protein [Bifidobacterium asteroides]PKV09401.1 camphor resistance CrcB-like protein [Bifidobacterium asteroides]
MTKPPTGPDMATALVVILGGTLGTGCRYALSLLPSQSGPLHPGTLLANLIACAGYALLTAFLAGLPKSAHARRRQLTNKGLGMGLCGGLSTMSTLSLELVQGLSGGHIQATLAYLLISFAGGLMVSWAMATLGARLSAHIRASAR